MESRVRAEREQKENRENRQRAEKKQREREKKRESRERVDLHLLIISPSDDVNDVSLAHHNYDVVILIDVMS